MCTAGGKAPGGRAAHGASHMCADNFPTLPVVQGINLRGDINVAIVGDPACAKSQMLK